MKTLKAHKEVEHEGKRYPCDLCEFVGKRQGHLKVQEYIFFRSNHIPPFVYFLSLRSLVVLSDRQMRSDIFSTDPDPAQLEKKSGSDLKSK